MLPIEDAGVPVAQEQILAREHRAESARSRKKQAAAEAAAGKTTTVTGGNIATLAAMVCLISAYLMYQTVRVLHGVPIMNY